MAGRETIRATGRMPLAARPGRIRPGRQAGAAGAGPAARPGLRRAGAWLQREVGQIGDWRLLRSARGRILGWSVLLLAAVMAAFTVATHQFLVQSMNTRISGDLVHEIAEFQAVAARSGAVSPSEPEDSGVTAATRRAATVTGILRARTRTAVLEHDTVLLGIVDGKIVTTSQNFRAARGPHGPALARLAALRAPASGVLSMAAGPARYSAVPVRVTGKPARGVFVAAVLTARQQAQVDSVTRLQVEVGSVALLAGSLLAWLLAGGVLRPVRATTELARRITESDLSERIPARGRNEVSEMAVTFNRMLDRLEAAMLTQHRFLADAGHELRTPITIIQGNLDTLAAGSPEEAETLAIVSDEISRMNRLVDDLLLLAGSERPDFLRPEPTDLTQLTQSLLVKARALDDRPWVLDGTAAGSAVLDPQRITQAVMQLAANAVAHTPAGSPVEISSQISDGMVRFTVSDRGPGIPAPAREQVFGRFARLDPRRTEGTGLGLAIVAAICAAHGGSVRVADRADGAQGALFCLMIPCRAATAGGAGGEPAAVTTGGGGTWAAS